MRRWVGAILAWLLKIKCRPQNAFAAGRGAILYANSGSWRTVLLLHFLLPADIVICVPLQTVNWLSLFMTGRQVIVVRDQQRVIAKQLNMLLIAEKKILLFPAQDRLFELSRIVAGLAHKTGAAAYPVVVGTGGKAGGLHVGDAVGLALNNTRKALAYKVYDALQSVSFWAGHQEQADLFKQLLATARKFGAGKIIAEDFNGSLSYQKLIIGCYVLGSKLRNACGEGERVGTLLPTSVGHVLAFFALCLIGKTPAILNFSSGVTTISDCAELAEVKSIITSRLFIEKAGLQHLIEKLQACCKIIYLEDVKQTITIKDKAVGLLKYLCRVKADHKGPAQVVLFTSGSENKPKGVLLSHANLIANVGQLFHGIDFSAKDKMFNALPMFHSFGLTGGVILPLLSGMETYLYPSPLHYKAIPEILCRKQATILLGTPTFLLGYAKNAGACDFQTLRYAIAGGEKLKEEIRTLWQDGFAIQLREAYGATEAAPGLCVSSHQFNKQGAVGRFLPGIEWRIQAVEGISKGGNLLIKGPNVMEGYLIHGRGFVPVGEWHDCGDVIDVDEEGYCTIIARLKRFAKISGEMVSLNQVEEAAEQCFQTDKNAAVSIADVKKGEKIILVSTKPDATKQQFREYLTRQQLSMLLLPAELIIVSELPVLGSGKVDYVRLQATITEL